ncbi:MAG: type II toxin-antitoxin system VapC family toxin [Chlorobi bacterium]|nr:type II toxin-antitoxin system VapC family toxin [Chlorobiota bacterium]
MSLSFDNQSAINYAILVSNRLHIGKTVSTEDARIAAIALTNNLVLVTRNTKDFLEIDGLTLVNPWEIT